LALEDSNGSILCESGKVAVNSSEALRQAVLKLWKNPETGHPFYLEVLAGDGK
jgi:hypothetical protein